MKLHNRIWTQVVGDVSPGAYGAVLARLDGDAIELLEIQPVREFVGDREALDVGFPFWSREARYEPSDLDPGSPDVQSAARSCGIRADASPLEIAIAMFAYGELAGEGPCGWASDVFPAPQRCRWWRARRPHGWRYLADEDREFRALLREAS